MKTISHMRDKVVKDVLRDVDSSISINACVAKQILEAQTGGGVKLANGDLNPLAFALRRPTWKAHLKFWLGEGRHYSTYKTLLTDARPPVLYLRSFSTHINEIPIRGRTLTEHLSEAYGNIGPVVAVGDPDSKKLINGPAMLCFGNDVWHAGVIYLMSVSQIVIIRAGMTHGTLWELGVARQKLNPEKLLIYVADGYPDNALDPTYSGAVEFYRDFKAYAEPVMGCELPRGNYMFIGFDKNWEPLVRDSGGAWPAKTVEREGRRQTYLKVNQIKASLASLYESYLEASKLPEDSFYSRDYLTWVNSTGNVVEASTELKVTHVETFLTIQRSYQRTPQLDKLISQLLNTDLLYKYKEVVDLSSSDVYRFVSQSSRMDKSKEILESLERDLRSINELAAILEKEVAEEAESVLPNRA